MLGLLADLDDFLRRGELDVPLAPGPVHLRFRIRREAGGFLFDPRFADDQRVTDVGDDWLLVEATVPSTRELRRWLFGFAPYIEAIDPPQLRALQAGVRLRRACRDKLATPEYSPASAANRSERTGPPSSLLSTSHTHALLAAREWRNNLPATGRSP